MLKSMGIPEEEIKKFSKPEYWIEFFAPKWIEDFKNLGYSIDWRRSFITTELNKPYDSFIKWQFKKLKEKGYIKKGSHPVVFCEKCNFPIGDHDRYEGEGVVPEEVILLKFNLNDIKIPVMTYRPETVYGVTNLWINPEEKYVEVEVNKCERWIISPNAIKNLINQDFEIKKIKEINGNELIGKYVENPVTKEKVMILPAEFVDVKIGTGIVMSVPAHAPFDYIAIKDLKNSGKFDLKDLNFKSLIKIDNYGEFPAVEIVEKMKIKSQKEKEKLEKATEEIYKKEFHTGILKIGNLKGKKVYEVKKQLIEEFINRNYGVKFYILPKEVICRCLTKAVVKIVKDQWFICYGDRKWKELAYQCVDKMKFYPDKIREDFNYVIGWLNDWACTRSKETSLGTTLPFDENQVIESLSDSTIYMAYYTIAHYLQNGKLKEEKGYSESFFDFIFYGIGDIEEVSKENNIDVDKLKKIREGFIYWYKNGFQLRNSGKDLLQNHLTFCIFNHVAIFPECNWPEGIGINGHILLDGVKMSKSKGNTIYIKDAVKEYGGDVIRFLCAYAGDSGMDDANVELKEAKTIETKLVNWYNFSINNYGRGVEVYRKIDKWFENILIKILKETEKNYENCNTKSALSVGFFSLQNYFKWYRRRCIKPNKNLLEKFIEIQTLILSPVVPHICEEIWEKIGKKEYISLSQWPKLDIEYSEDEEKSEKIISNLYEDIKSVINLCKLDKIKKIKIILPEKWKYSFVKELEEKLKETRNFGELIKIGVKYNADMKKIQRYIQKILKSGFDEYLENEEEYIRDAKEFFENEFKCEIEFLESGEKDSWPGKFGIIVI
ncbi:MAG: leucine--tRNA ligase [Candidatus Aenigmarchaeota archaeon ex4484_56]|nr:MAG: leucine--tRNA ligase [Candidatus Aenigmarchaeota archaeon ex4484_56]